MISGEYNAVQAYQSFNTQLLEESPISENIVLEPQKTYSNIFHTNGGMKRILLWQTLCEVFMAQMC